MSEQAVVHQQSTTNSKQQGQKIQQIRINNEDGNQGESSIKNATQYHDVGVISQNAINNFTSGIAHIYEVVSNKPGFFQFLEAFREDHWASQSEGQGDKSNQEIRENQDVVGHEVEKYDDHLKQADRQIQIEHLNKTPFFGSLVHASKPSKSQQTNLPNILSSIVQKISVKQNQAIQQLVHNYSKQKTSAQSILETIIKKTTESVEQITTNYENIEVMEAMGKSAQHQQLSELGKKNTNKIMKIDQDNQFMMEQFGTHQKFQEVQQYVENLKKETVEKYIRENYDQVAKFQFKMKEFVDKRSIQMGFEKIKKRSGVTPDNDKNQSPNRDNNRVNSGAISQRISSAQSQRLRSAISKNSENDESFNLDLTVKTRNSKNPYQLGKQDSLMYSVDSGFGFQPDSPTKLIKNNENPLSNKSAREKMDEIYEQKQENQGRKNGLKKSYSQRVDQYKPQESPSKRMKSQKDKIDENQVLEEQENHDRYQGKQGQKYQGHKNYPEGAEHQQGFFKPKYRDYSEEQNQENDIQPQLQSNQKHIKEVKPTKQMTGKKSKLSQHGQRQDRSSIKQGTIIDKMDNFDADDEDEDDKQLHESAHFSKKKSTEQLVRKRVQTEVGKHKKETKDTKSQNYSIKNIKRFNKVDFSKHEEQAPTNRQNTQIVSHSGSNSNIFATEIEGYHKKISKLKEQKQRKKKELEKELARINYEIKALHQKQQELSPQNKNNYASRVKISDNNEAQKKAESLVKNLRSQKRNRNLAKLGQFSNLDKNINDYMEELNKFRLQNEEKTKQKKKIQILERMKQNQVRKLKEKKKISENQQFVLHLKGVGGPTQPLNVKQEARQQILSKRSPTKQQQQVAVPTNITPELSQKKAYLNKIRSFSVKKQKRDPYEQLLN